MVSGELFDHPVYTADEARSRETFLALMGALSYPGRIYTLPADGMEAFHAIADTLLDLETSYFTPDETLADDLAPSGARSLSPVRAAYHFYPVLTADRLALVKEASAGTLLDPDTGATLIIGCQLGAGRRFRLRGPGIPAAAPQSLQVAGLPEDLWALREAANRYPRGWDIYLLDGAQLVGLPRTTQLDVEV